MIYEFQSYDFTPVKSYTGSSYIWVTTKYSWLFISCEPFQISCHSWFLYLQSITTQETILRHTGLGSRSDYELSLLTSVLKLDRVVMVTDNDPDVDFRWRLISIGEQGWRSGESAGFDSGSAPYVGGVFCWSLPCFESFSSGSLVFLPLQNSTSPNFP